MARLLSNHPQPPTEVAVRAWSMRNSIPGKYWDGMVQAATHAGQQCSLAELAEFSEKAAA